MKTYEKPRIRDFGDLATLTASFDVGNTFDANFVIGEPIPPGFDILSCDPGTPLPCVDLSPGD